MTAELDQDDQDDGRDIDAAEIGQGVSDRTQERFGQPVQELPDLIDIGI